MASPDSSSTQRESSRSSGIELIDRARSFAERVAVRDSQDSMSFHRLLDAAHRRARILLDTVSHAGPAAETTVDLEERRVAFLVTPSNDYVVTQWAIWLAGGIAVPLCVSHPTPELEYVLTDSDACLVLCSRDRAVSARAAVDSAGADSCGRSLLILDSELRDRETAIAPLSSPGRSLPSIDPARRAMIVYTSGTTGRPKGVVTTHANIAAQVRALVEAWQWRRDDAIVNVLPLHHIHGIVNVVCCSLWSGARVDFLPRFDAKEVWDRFASGELTLFMAVPTVYSKLVSEWRQASTATRIRWSEGARDLRLMVSGSAALPVSILEQWLEITGHRLLERYGMSETGMILSNPLQGERVAGSVGTPLPGVEVRLKEGGESNPENGEQDSIEGELEVRGPAVFREYWRRSEETASAFDVDWFQTGDRVEVASGRYRILGRTSVDILKTGGYKVSALEIEEVLRQHPDIAEVAVVGVADEEWGERVSAAVVLARAESALDLEQLRSWAKERLASYKVPSRMLVLEELPRNALGKVTKPEVTRLFEQSEQARQ